MISHKEMIEEIKKHLKKHGFEEKGRTNEGFLILKKKEKGNNGDN